MYRERLELTGFKNVCLRRGESLGRGGGNTIVFTAVVQEKVVFFLKCVAVVEAC